MIGLCSYPDGHNDTDVDIQNLCASYPLPQTLGAVSAKKCGWRSQTWSIASNNGSIRIRKDYSSQCSGRSDKNITEVKFVWSFGHQWGAIFKQNVQVRPLSIRLITFLLREFLKR